MKYYLDQLDPVKFQQLINAILIKKYGDDIRLTPLRGSDGGRDGETAPNNPFTPFIIDVSTSDKNNFDESLSFRPGRYMFQVKHHDTASTRISDLRNVVAAEFEKELATNVVTQKGSNRVNYFFLITNVSSSESSIEKVDSKRRKLLKSFPYLHADIWWGERVFALLDTMPAIWHSFPELFPGGKVPLVGNLVSGVDEHLTKTVRIFLSRQYQQDKYVKFRQVEIEHDLEQLFVDLTVNIEKIPPALLKQLHYRDGGISFDFEEPDAGEIRYIEQRSIRVRRNSTTLSLTKLLMSEREIGSEGNSLTRIILEGGPGQGKSTATQMVAQIYRKTLLQAAPSSSWSQPSVEVIRLPFRLELREFAEFVDQNNSRSVEEYLTTIIKTETGGRTISVNDIQSIVERSPIILIFDGLDEVGNDNLRNLVLQRIHECIYRFQNDFNSNVRVILTTRPPALAGHHENLQEYFRLPIAPLNETKIRKYMDNWLKVQIRDESEKKRIQTSFERRLGDHHVKALATNPMQLSILLHFIRIKGEAFPNSRSQLYRSYFETVIDRDVEKSVGISADRREIVESLHKFLGYKIHSETEAKQLDGTFPRKALLNMVNNWLIARGNDAGLASDLFKLGEERLGLIVIVRGEGEEAQYGFEIQPVREYFAAAFINDEIKGEVEPIFQQMLVRPFWREVALFLGGLRRNREKANLILQAKDLDASVEIGWRQYGRNIIMQLLQEGVFSQPPQAYQLALEFVTEALDPQIIPRQLELDNYVALLPQLITQNTASDNVPKKQVLQMLKANRDIDDEYSLQRIYRVATEILDFKTVDKVFDNYENEDIDFLAKVKIVWPFVYGKQKPENFQIPLRFSDNELSKWWWYTANRNPNLQVVQIPERFHQLLLEEYALRPNLTTEIVSMPKSSWAVWHLMFLSKVLRTSIRGRGTNKLQSIQSYLHPKNSSISLDYSGVSASTKHIVSTLIEIMVSTIVSISERKKGEIAISNISKNFRLLGECIRYPGLDGWIALHGTNLILRTLLDDPFFTYNLTGARDEFEKERLMMIEQIHQLQEIMGNEGFDLRDLIGHYQHSDKIYDIDGTQITLENLLTLDIQNKLSDNAEWVSRVPLNLNLIPDLVSRFKDNLSILLRWIGHKKDYISLPEKQRLHVSVQRAIINYVSNTTDLDVLRGAFVALSSSSFIAIAGEDNILKMLAASKNLILAVNIFKREPFEQQLNENQTQILIAVARSILDKPELYGLKLANASAKYIVDYYHYPIPPLINSEEILGINVV